MARLWKHNPETPEGKYLVLRRDGTVPMWPSFVLGAADPAAAAALRAYAEAALKLNRMAQRDPSLYAYDTRFIDDIFELADEFDRYREDHGFGDPSAGPHRETVGWVLQLMKLGKGS